MLTGTETSIDFLHSLKVKVWGAQIVFADWVAERFEPLMEYNTRLGVECPQFADAPELLARQLERVLAQVGRRYDCGHLVAPLSLQTE